ncbi:MAG: discoidin domain-containing protein [Candidatus Erginobacter occultus]|nr:discoidin domain-containing protein [Candidatus Erginobacter occultus]
MEKFSKKEKIALVVFGLILLAIIFQMLIRVNILEIGTARIAPLEVVEIDLSGNLLNQPGVRLSASSLNQNNQSPDRLIDGNPQSFWHIALDQVGEPAWVIADFGAEKKFAVRAMAALPREDIPRQFFRSAQLLGSDDGENWTPVSSVILWGTPRRAGWWKWGFENELAYRYYKLLITDGHEGGDFYSMAGLAFFE